MWIRAVCSCLAGAEVVCQPLRLERAAGVEAQRVTDDSCIGLSHSEQPQLMSEFLHHYRE